MTTNEDIMSELVYNAESGKHRQFQYLSNYIEYRRARQLRRTHELLVASLKQSLTKQLKRYCKAVKACESDVTHLLAYKTTENILAFYEEELNIINSMIIEYECYLVNGNLLDFVFGYQRTADKLWDHRSL